ncbi:MAG TPA: DUF4231 domain-containing protein [Coriobacteriia bacterium]|jgi:hypothetical protein
MLEDAAYPRTYAEADRLAKRTQSLHQALTKANLLLLAFAAMLAIVGALLPAQVARVMSGVAAFLTFCAVIIWFILARGRFDNLWFDARAVAESLKTMTWRYMMHGRPYESGLTKKDADDRFFSEIAEVLDEQADVANRLKCPENAPEITDKMREVRGMPWEERLHIYVQDRVRDQKQYYGRRSNEHRRSAQQWSAIVFALQVVAIVAAVWTVARGGTDLSGLAVAWAGFGMTWTQTNQYSTLAHSYGMTAQEFALIESKMQLVESNASLVRHVEEAELAASREHTMWVARNVL